MNITNEWYWLTIWCIGPLQYPFHIQMRTRLWWFPSSLVNCALSCPMPHSNTAIRLILWWSVMLTNHITECPQVNFETAGQTERICIDCNVQLSLEEGQSREMWWETPTALEIAILRPMRLRCGTRCCWHLQFKWNFKISRICGDSEKTQSAVTVLVGGHFNQNSQRRRAEKTVFYQILSWKRIYYDWYGQRSISLKRNNGIGFVLY